MQQETITKQEFRFRSEAHEFLAHLQSFGYHRVNHNAPLYVGAVRLYPRLDGSWVVEYIGYEAY